jgi:predicted ATPase
LNFHVVTSLREQAFRVGLIGREREIEELAAHRRAAVRGHGRIALVGGDAGIGKSTLLRSFTAPFSGGRTFGQSHCVEFVQTPLSPLRALLSQLDRRVGKPADPAIRSLIDRLTFERVVEPASDSLPGGALFDSLDAAFAHYALRGTLIFVIEDIHWADRSTLAFLTYFAERIEKRRTLVVATYRSDEVGAAHPRLADFAALLSKRAVAHLLLSPLGTDATQLLVERLVPAGTLQPATVAGIARRSAGNAFFAEELVKSAVDNRTAPAHALPLSIRGAVLARAAQLSEEDRSIVSLSAVLGERFSIDQLIALTDGNRETVLRALERSRKLSLLYDEPLAPGEIAFRHALTQEVLYGELLAERVRPLHEAIALELEARSDRDALSVELAHHWRRAGDLRRACLYDELAGDHAAGIGAFADAVLYYERALVAHDGASAELEHKTGVALGAFNHLIPGIERLYRAADIYREAGDFEGFAKNASALGALLYNSGDPEAATRVYRDAVDVLRSKLPSDALNLLRARIAYNCVAALDFDSASTFADELPESIADPFVAVYVCQTRFRIAAMRGRRAALA